MTNEDLERNFGLLIADVSRLMKTDYDRRVAHTGLTRSQWWVLTFLFRKDGITQAELANELDVERPALGRLLDRLESNNWVRRETDPQDRRARLVFLTEEVQPIMSEMRRIAATLRSDATAGLAPDHIEQLVDTLLTIKSNVTRSLNSDEDDAVEITRKTASGQR